MAWLQVATTQRSSPRSHTVICIPIHADRGKPVLYAGRQAQSAAGSGSAGGQVRPSERASERYAPLTMGPPCKSHTACIHVRYILQARAFACVVGVQRQRWVDSRRAAGRHGVLLPLLGALTATRRDFLQNNSIDATNPCIPDAYRTAQSGPVVVVGCIAYTPLQNCLFTPELQWQSRGKRRVSQGSTTGADQDLIRTATGVQRGTPLYPRSALAHELP